MRIVSFIFYVAESLNFVKAKQLILSIIEQMKSFRDNTVFDSLFSQVLRFCTENGIDFNQHSRQRRQKKVPIRFNDAVVTTTIGHREYFDNVVQYRTRIYYPLIDSILIELNHRFSSDTINVLVSLSSLCPNNENFLEFEKLKPFAEHLNVNLNELKNELKVLQAMLQKKDVLVANIIQFYHELLAYKLAFPNVVLMVQGALTMPVTSSTCERSFSKMKTIKTTLRNTMGDTRLSDLCVLAVERDVLIDFDNVVEVFYTNHKNSRILLK